MPHEGKTVSLRVMVLKTREKLIDVARQLFAHKGVANTTMSDIAEASEKGRRTIYTYFKNKKEIYNAVVESESDKLVTSLREIATGDGPVADRLVRFMQARLEHGRAIGSVYRSLVSWLKLDARRVERIHKLVSEKEDALLRSLLDEGVRSGDFDAEAAELFLCFARRCFGGLDLSNIDTAATPDHRKAHAAFVTFVMAALVKKR